MYVCINAHESSGKQLFFRRSFCAIGWQQIYVLSDIILGDTELETLLRACATAREVYWLLQVLIRGIEVSGISVLKGR